MCTFILSEFSSFLLFSMTPLGQFHIFEYPDSFVWIWKSWKLDRTGLGQGSVNELSKVT